MRGWLISGIGSVLVGAAFTTVGCRDGQVDVLVEIAGSSGGTTTTYVDELPPEDGEPPDPTGTGGTDVSVNPLEGEGGTLPASTGGSSTSGGKSSSGGAMGNGGTTSGGTASGGAGSGGTSGMDGGTSGGEAPGGGGAGGDLGAGAGGEEAGGDGGTSTGGNPDTGTSGISGVAGSGCGNFVVEASEQCDPPLTPGCSATCTKDACRLCEEEESKCPAIAAADNRAYTFCEQLTGNAAAGPKVGIPKAQLCLDVLRCARANKCAGAVAPEACYCGEVDDLAQCFAASAVATGDCVGEFQGAAESSSPPDISARFESEDYALGVAVKLLKCDGEVCLSECVPTP